LLPGFAAVVNNIGDPRLHEIAGRSSAILTVAPALVDGYNKQSNSPTGLWPYPTSSNPRGSPQLSKVRDGDRRYQERTTALM
jgi:hypothetical protein